MMPPAMDSPMAASDATTFEIPGTAFPGDSVYAVGVAGVVHTTGDQLDNMNTALSTIMTGDMKVYAVNTAML